jgi:DNA polymerase V
MQHGGKRTGAGRPKSRATKPLRVPVSLLDDVIALIEGDGFGLPLYGVKVEAGFPSIADDHIERHLDLHKYLVKQPAATFLLRAAGESMIEAGIYPNDLLVVDRSVVATSGKIVIAAVDGDFTVKQLLKKDGKILLMPANPKFNPIDITGNENASIWGVVMHVIHSY